MNSITSLDSISDSDIEMRTARSQITISAEAIEPPGVAIGLDSLKENFTNIEEHTATAPSLDLLDRMRNSYRLLDLVIDSATNGSVDKVVIAQDSIEKLMNRVEPGSYSSVTKVNFRALDKHAIKPLGVYGTIDGIVAFLEDLQCIDRETAHLLSIPRDKFSGATRPTLRPGLYLIKGREDYSELSYIVFWPEDTTWDDGKVSSVSHNRVAFMRYLTKLCDQVICLIDSSCADKLVWPDVDEHPGSIDHDQIDDNDLNERMFNFSVEQTPNQDEGATATEGFSFAHNCIHEATEHPPGYPADFPLAILQPRLVSGEVNQGILCATYLSENVRSTPIDISSSSFRLTDMLQRQQIRIEKEADRQTLSILREFGLTNRCGLEAQFIDLLQRKKMQLQKDKEAKSVEDQQCITRIMQSLAIPLLAWLTRQALFHFPGILGEEQLLDRLAHASHIALEVPFSSAYQEAENSLAQDSHITSSVQLSILERVKKLQSDYFGRYNTLKRQYCVISALNSNSTISEEKAQRFVDLITLDPQSPEEFNAKVMSLISEKSSGYWHSMTTWLTGDKKKNLSKWSAATQLPDDIAFWKKVQYEVQSHQAYADAAEEIRAQIIILLVTLLLDIQKTLSKSVKSSLIISVRKMTEQMFRDREEAEDSEHWLGLRDCMYNHLEKSYDDSRPGIRITKVFREGYSQRTKKSFRVIGTRFNPKKADFEYKFFPFEIKQHELQEVSINPSHFCQPFINDKRMQTFGLRRSSKLKAFRLIGRENCLIILETAGKLDIYFDNLGSIASAIEGGRHKRQFDLEKVGVDNLHAIDESKRLLALLSSRGRSIHINVYSFNEMEKTIYPRCSPIDITRWYQQGVPIFEKFLFVPGTEELLLVDNKGASRLFSLTTEKFRPKTIQLGYPLKETFTTPDGSCLLVMDEENGKPRLRCFHWESFGENTGIRLEIPSWVSDTTPVTVSSVGHRDNTHVIFLQPEAKMCSSLMVNITRKSSSFVFRHNLNEVIVKSHRETTHNSLLDCHVEVWTRFPIRPPIYRESNTPMDQCPRALLFISDHLPGLIEPYFLSSISEFESKTRKPTEGTLREIKISSRAAWDPSDIVDPVSSFYLGDWLVGLFCLIPIHLAVTGSNRFIPLKDGVISAEFERELLGANVNHIAQTLSFGWYESIFSSYLADKPVKVVTSMGEQSVGKSYALNHFTDTSFAGSAMRCTEGVWLSVTPTHDYLIVAMDFEGVQSIERSAQEDMLLVLLNTAVSNFVLFRNNFALSRDIAGLFTSFQSCINVLDPAANPSLFQSCLQIIIKDVIASDTDEMVKEFYLKFDRIVQEEGKDNFITKLHRGKLGIITWPVIESAGFYKFFHNLKSQFMKQPVTHEHAGSFLVVLKTLMAKLKANDWGALDQNLAAQRAQFLSDTLHSALCFGMSDPYTEEPLKSCDTDQNISKERDPNILYLPNMIHPVTGGPLTLTECLLGIRKCWDGYLRRYSMKEDDYFLSYQDHLEKVASIRVKLVHQWLQTNTCRFTENAEIKAVYGTFEDLVKEIKTALTPCGVICSSCNLRCLDYRHHEGDHDCFTNHKCSRFCGFIDQHQGDDPPPCALPAGHDSRHVCRIIKHLCGMPCQLSGKDGCFEKCSKPMDHEEEEHICSAMVHACGAPCDLIGTDGIPLCIRTCVTDSRAPHDRHCCERSFACPKKCELCKSYCSVPNHFHALEPDVHHLCGQEHRCPHQCEISGICDIASAPQSIESTFVGKYSMFQYTKYSQEARRLPCSISIPSDQLEHKGKHVHSTDSTIFHFCEARCQHCGYYCTLPLGHNQAEHHTRHGSMEESVWFLEGEDDTFLEIENRRYATGDSGAPMLCSMFCKTMGRHVHISKCRADNPAECKEEEVEHINRTNLRIPRDWISHKLYWARSGFEDPYSYAERIDFGLCDYRCPGEEHKPDINLEAAPSYCTLPLFHPHADLADAPPSGHVSYDGHAYLCKNPALLQKSYHIFFALDRSRSMTLEDRKPVSDTPVTERIVATANNRFGAVLSSLYGFWVARDAAMRSRVSQGTRRDAYTVLIFDSTAKVVCENDFNSTPDQLLEKVPAKANYYGGTSFTQALKAIQLQMEASWSTERSPVVIFLSDGECGIQEETISDLCRTSVRLGKSLAFHAISFGRDRYSRTLKRMAAIARDIYVSGPDDPLTAAPETIPCAFHNALDTDTLVDTFDSIAMSLRNPRAALYANHPHAYDK